MPNSWTASLRRLNPVGFGQGCVCKRLVTLRNLPHGPLLVIVAGAIVVAAPSARPAAGSAAHTSTAPGRVDRKSQPAPNPTVLWSRFPLGQRPVSSERATKRGPGSATSRVQLRHDGSRSSQFDPKLAMLYASIVLLVLVTTVVLVKRRLASPAVGPKHRRRSALPRSEHSGGHLRAQVIDRRARSVGMAAAARHATSGDLSGVERRLGGHLVFVPTDKGYALLERPGDAPPLGGELDGKELGVKGRFSVSRIRSSPLPGDQRDCACLERA
jgi:hypothetical protein